MSATSIETPAPVVETEQKIENAAPTAVQPEIAQVEAGFNEVLDSSAEKGAATEADYAKVDPALDKAARDARAIATGGKVDPTALVSDATHVVKEVKEGYKTTEFWVAAAGIVLTQIGALHLPGKYGSTITTGALAGAYILSRGLAK